MRRLLGIAGAVLLVLAAAPAFAQSSISVDDIQGKYGDATLDTVGTVSYEPNLIFKLRYVNGEGLNEAISNGFEIYSPDGATWSGPVAGDTLTGAVPRSNWDIQFQMNVFDTLAAVDTPKDTDTIGIIGAKISSSGLPAGFDGVPYGLRIGSFDNAEHGLHICVDSAWFRPGGTWKWAASGGVNAFPAWDGPYCFLIVDTAQLTDVKEIDGQLPTEFTLGQNYPNPFNPVTLINFDIPRNSKVNLSVYNVLGQLVKVLVDKDMTAGKYQADWDGTSDSGAKVASGIYFYKIEADNFVQTKKMMLLK
ncbi:MAG: T9SS type A sorting domain-containing protein [Candidatus Zixiibacteriota bacterium]